MLKHTQSRRLARPKKAVSRTLFAENLARAM